MNTKLLILIVGVFLLAPVASATDEVGFAMDMLSPQTSVMDVGMEDAVYMTAELQPMSPSVYGSGRMRHVGWYDNRDAYRQSFLIMVGVKIPSKVPGFGTLEEAMNADVRVRVSANGVAFAECLLAANKIISRSAVYYSVDLTAVWDDVRPNRGICDIDLNQKGIQVGIPHFYHKDHLMTYVVREPYAEFAFLDGYCY